MEKGQYGLLAAFLLSDVFLQVFLKCEGTGGILRGEEKTVRCLHFDEGALFGPQVH